MGVAGDWSIHNTLVQDQLHALDATAKVRVEVPRDGREGNLVLLVRGFLGLRNVQRVTEYAKG